MSRTSLFRGYAAIREVLERIQPLAQWYKVHRPEARVLTLRRRDIDLLQRWPQAARIHEIFTHEGVTSWRGFTLRADKSPPRYAPPQGHP
jgi:hypothetical protein